MGRQADKTRLLELNSNTVAGLGDERQQGATRMSATAYDPVTESTLGDSLSVEERQRLESLLRQYRNVFAYPGNDGHVTDIEHTIPLTTNDTIVCRPRRLPTQLKAEVETEVQNFPQRGIVRTTVSGYAAPVCPVKKKDGTSRLRVDYRDLNSKTKDTAIPIQETCWRWLIRWRECGILVQ